ncbi:MAG: ribonuclease P protein component [Brockia lithotrophica]|nr:ribonuclease P protein component [Brockia lithotrophica]
MEDVGLSRKDRLRKNEDFERVITGGKSVADPRLVVYYERRDDGGRAVGVSVGRRLGDAVLRNRYKRRLREILRRALPHIRPGYNLVVLLRRGGIGAEFSELEASLLRLLKRAKLWQESEGVPPSLEDGDASGTCGAEGEGWEG